MIMKKVDSLAYMPYNIILFQTLKYGGEPVSVLVGGGGGVPTPISTWKGCVGGPKLVKKEFKGVKRTIIIVLIIDIAPWIYSI